METQSYAVTIQRVLVLQALRYIFHSWRRNENTVSSGLVECRAGNVLMHVDLSSEEPRPLASQHAFGGYVSKRRRRHEHKMRTVTVHIKPGLTVTYCTDVKHHLR